MTDVEAITALAAFSTESTTGSEHRQWEAAQWLFSDSRDLHSWAATNRTYIQLRVATVQSASTAIETDKLRIQLSARIFIAASELMLFSSMKRSTCKYLHSSNSGLLSWALKSSSCRYTAESGAVNPLRLWQSHRGPWSFSVLGGVCFVVQRPSTIFRHQGGWDMSSLPGYTWCASNPDQVEHNWVLHTAPRTSSASWCVYPSNV